MLTPEQTIDAECIEGWREYLKRHLNELPGAPYAMQAQADALCDMALAHLAAAQQGEAWQPIESAPKDGTSILGYADKTYATVSYYSTVNNYVDGWWNLDVQGAYSEDSEWTPTHWMPLPAAPVNKESNREAD